MAIYPIQYFVMKREKRIYWFGTLFFITFIFVFKGIPLIVCVVSSFTNWDGLYQYEFIGLKNYIKIFKDEKLFLLVRNSLVLQLHVVIEVLSGFIIAMTIYISKVRHKIGILYILYLPQIFSGTIMAQIFKILFGYDGIINAIISVFGVAPQLFLEEVSYSLGIINLCYIWTETGVTSLIFYARFLMIAKSIKDLLDLDGASCFTKIIYIYIPLTYRTIIGILIINTIYSLSSAFSFVHILTKGGPAYDTTTFDYIIYTKAYTIGNNLGLACAYSVSLICGYGLVVLLVACVRKMLKKD